MRHVYLEAAFTEAEARSLIKALTIVSMQVEHDPVMEKFALDLMNHLDNTNPNHVTHFEYDSEEVLRTRNLCIVCDEHPATDNSAECESCETREIV